MGNDWETMRRRVAAGLDYPVTGMPYWTFDAGGFFRPGAGQYTDPGYHERFLRWLRLATSSPLMRVHGYQTNTEPWRFGGEVEAEAPLHGIAVPAAPVSLQSGGRDHLPRFHSDASAGNGFPERRARTGAEIRVMFGPSLLVRRYCNPASGSGLFIRR